MKQLKIDTQLASKCEVRQFTLLNERLHHLRTPTASLTKFLTPELTRELDNALDDWLNCLILAIYRAGCLIGRLIREFKIL